MAEVIKRPRVVVEKVERGHRHVMWIARCEHCPWGVGPSGKSYLEESEARPHRAKHRAGEAPACDVAVVLTESGEDWTWTCGCGASVPGGWHGSPFEHAAAVAALDAIAHGHRGPITWPERLPVAVVQAADKYVDARRAELEADYLAAKLRRAA
ncbi:MAG: hypothetical protein K0S43_388 [Cellulosimicrobium sp.]|nr:hypothetical protein [Cellulosimicrobium sp.]